MHIGFIVDGNRRWARAHNLPVFEGHKKGLENIEMVITELARLNLERPPESQVKFASFYVFSTENWQRSREEVDNLMSLASSRVLKLARKMAKNNIRCLILGSRENVSPSLLQQFDQAVELTKDCDGLTACLCFNYGGQQEIVDAARSLALEYKDAAHAALHSVAGDNSVPRFPSAEEFFTAERFAGQLYQPSVPPLDLIVRTSGESRLSGFMLWRAAYAELLFLDKYYPELSPEDVKEILAEYSRRERRFGK